MDFGVEYGIDIWCCEWWCGCCGYVGWGGDCSGSLGNCDCYGCDDDWLGIGLFVWCLGNNYGNIDKSGLFVVKEFLDIGFVGGEFDVCCFGLLNGV